MIYTMATPEKFHRKTTVTIVEKLSSELLRYDVLEPTDCPSELVSNYFDRFVEEVLPQMRRGEERFYLLYHRADGLRPDVREVGIINKTFYVGRSVMGRPDPGFIESFPHRVAWGDAKVVKKGAFPRPPGADPSAIIDDGGIDEHAIRAALLSTYSLLRAAVAETFNEPSRLALLDGLSDLMRSTGTPGGPSDNWYSGGSMAETAVDMYDVAILLWLESEAANALPQDVREGYLERMQLESDDFERSEYIMEMAKIIERNGLF